MKSQLSNYNVVENIDLLSFKYNVSDVQLCEAMQISIATLRRRKKQPDTFTLSEIELAAKKLQTTPAKLLGSTQDILLSENPISTGVKECKND